MESSGAGLSTWGIVFRLLAVLLLVFANAFFVAAEFGLVGARRSRIDAAAARGERSAKHVQQA
ncbi:MAG: CNNM domain-containing protein, partial [Gemmatimonadaceae bacterium]